MVKINNSLDPICNLYHNGKFVGIIKNNTALLDVLAQIKENWLSGYSIRFNKRDYPIEECGIIRNPPKGFYDSSDKSLQILCGF